LEDLNERGEVVAGKERESIIEIGISSTLGAAAIIAKVVIGTSSMSPGPKHFVDRAKYLVNDEAGKGQGERVTLGEAILLNEMVEGAVGSVKETVIGLFVPEVKIVYESMETWFGFKVGKGGFTRHLIPTICQVHEDAPEQAGDYWQVGG
jgi:hypothetical protein